MPAGLPELRYFVVVARTLSIRGAAEEIGMRPSRLSEAIRRLEAEVGTPLLTRTTRRMELTPAGEALVPRAKRALRAVDAALDAARRAGPDSRSADRAER